MENLYRMIFNKLESKFLSGAKNLVEGVEEILLFLMMYKISMQLFALSLVSFLMLASFSLFDVPIALSLRNALIFTSFGVFVTSFFIVIIAGRKRTITKAMGLDEQLKRLTGQKSFEEDLMKMIFEFISKNSQLKVEIEKFKRIEKSLEAVADALASLQQNEVDKNENNFRSDAA